MTVTKDEFFKPEKLTAQQKAAATNSAAAQILAAEAAHRTKKTDRLRELRLAHEATLVAVAPKVSRAKKAKALTP
ncbi:hypothetical protein G6L28_15790 [Agrobacterium larrymoorei]|uniref:hypothetical protein n=1 Tax=Agrobacterium larrymoorei TaxID=160699 RepID=UPI00157318CB|nr:hypothetical protein [Agrobacterium larrymoorei]NTJ44063.1 hypothetical protein [Agrobacterium larrymoorei]